MSQIADGKSRVHKAEDSAMGTLQRSLQAVLVSDKALGCPEDGAGVARPRGLLEVMVVGNLFNGTSPQ